MPQRIFEYSVFVTKNVQILNRIHYSFEPYRYHMIQETFHGIAVITISSVHSTQIVLQLQQLSKLTKLGSAYGSKSSHHRTTQSAAAASQRVTQVEGEQSAPQY